MSHRTSQQVFLFLSNAARQNVLNIERSSSALQSEIATDRLLRRCSAHGVVRPNQWHVLTPSTAAMHAHVAETALTLCWCIHLKGFLLGPLLLRSALHVQQLIAPRMA